MFWARTVIQTGDLWTDSRAPYRLDHACNEVKKLASYFQAISEQVTEGTQTDWKYPRNANTQTYPREYTEDEQAALVATKECSDFVHEVAFE